MKTVIGPGAVAPVRRTRRSLFEFPNPVNDNAARIVAAGVAILALTTLVTGWLWFIPLLAVGFAARVLSGPRFSLLGRLATQVIAPRLGPAIMVPGPPKRFAQAIGLTLTTVATVAAFGFGADRLALALAAVLLAFASLESIFGLCAGCWLFGLLMRAGVIPSDVCEACHDIRLRHAEPSSTEAR
ncbi:MAG TPA: DUF4395 domain-containing protein [Microlunatus sp.]